MSTPAVTVTNVLKSHGLRVGRHDVVTVAALALIAGRRSSGRPFPPAGPAARCRR
ncbi:ubiquitin-like domain-containing protein [Burkholderia sp. LMU1-1-1.1]|uniref:ubiquitin-like domain-containing protein n=1 Tax=Burkholderia sp. LMU1-1-1.1 TaxID=3135266 RepID=UPI003415FCAC